MGWEKWMDGEIDTCDALCRRAAFWNMQRRPVVQTVGIPCVQPLMLESEGWVGLQRAAFGRWTLGAFLGCGRVEGVGAFWRWGWDEVWKVRLWFVMDAGVILGTRLSES